jgi:ABC-type multidrug transport system ATPase subunit
LTLLLERFVEIPGIGKIFSVPSEKACSSDEFVPGADLEQVNHLLGSAQTVTTKSDDSSLTSLDPHTDPFAKREGKTLMWRNVNMTLVSSITVLFADNHNLRLNKKTHVIATLKQLNRGKKPNKKILDNIWGEVPANETTAIMGASGAGKSSLLNLLSGRVKSGGKIRVQSDVRLNNYRVYPTDIRIRRSVAFVAQDDSLQATATPRETIRFSAKLRLPRSTTDHQLDQLTERMIQELGLKSCADTVVGGLLIKGISGGERKRASVGVELVVKPSMVFLDEPTSGLDSCSAVQVCQVLKKVANSGASVLFTIHQPSSEIFTSFDRLILLHEVAFCSKDQWKASHLILLLAGFRVP